MMVYKVSPGKAYVKGYEVEVRSPSLIDVEKPRTTRLLENQAVNFAFGPTVEVNNVSGSPLIGFNTSTVLSLRDQRVGGIATAAPGTEIGLARVDFVMESGSCLPHFGTTCGICLCLMYKRMLTLISISASL